MTLQTRLGHRFRDLELLEKALTHRSRFSDGDAPYDNEQLEYLGDAVLKLSTSARLMELFPGASEGDLTRMRAFLVSDRHLSEVAAALDLSAHIRLGRQMRMEGALAGGSAVMPDALEALLGAVFLDGGYAAADQVVRTLLDEAYTRVRTEGRASLRDSKTELQERLVRRFQGHPEYALVRTETRDGQLVFVMSVRFHDLFCEEGEGRSKKEASQEAARKVLERWTSLVSREFVGPATVNTAEDATPSQTRSSE